MHLSTLYFTVCGVIHVSPHISVRVVTTSNGSQSNCVISRVLPHGRYRFIA